MSTAAHPESALKAIARSQNSCVSQTSRTWGGGSYLEVALNIGWESQYRMENSEEELMRQSVRLAETVKLKAENVADITTLLCSLLPQC